MTGRLLLSVLVAAGVGLPPRVTAHQDANGARIAPLRAAIDAGIMTRRQHVDDVLAAIARLDGGLRAYITVDAVGARAVADAGDDGARSVAPVARGPLDGVVVAVKDNIETAGVATTAGASSLAALRPPLLDAGVVVRLRAAGAVVVGKTNLDTWARGVRGLSQVRGQSVNPLDRTRNAGGSSAGSAVAVAAGMADVAVGTDTCGSLRYPASSTGIYALRPTPGLVSRSGVVPLAPTQDVVGPMAADPADLAVLLDVLSGVDARDPLTSSVPSVLPAAPQGRPLRVGVVRGMGTVDAGVLAKLRESGVEMVNAGALPASARSSGSASVIEDEALPSRESYVRWRSAVIPGGVDPWLIGRLVVADTRGYRARLAARDLARSAVVALMDRLQVDALALPTTTAGPVRLGQRQPSGNCHVAANAGLPALAVPAAHRDGAVPPVGVELLGRPWAERTLLVLAGHT